MRQEYKRVAIRVFGRVQGVFFRQTTKEVAEKLGLTGWVRNEPGSSVFIVAEGEENELQKLIEWCKKGTEETHVKSVGVTWYSDADEFSEFQIVP